MVISQLKEVPLLLMEIWQTVRYSETEHPAWISFRFKSQTQPVDFYHHAVGLLKFILYVILSWRLCFLPLSGGMEFGGVGEVSLWPSLQSSFMKVY